MNKEWVGRRITCAEKNYLCREELPMRRKKNYLCGEDLPVRIKISCADKNFLGGEFPVWRNFLFGEFPVRTISCSYNFQ